VEYRTRLGSGVGLLTKSGFALAISAWEQMVISDEITSRTLDDVAAIANRLAPFLLVR
jgi:hypothetical protein